MSWPRRATRLSEVGVIQQPQEDLSDRQLCRTAINKPPVENRSEKERKKLVLEAGAKRLRQAQVNWLKGVTFDELTADTEIDRSQIAKDFGSKHEFGKQLIEYCLTPSNYDEEWSADLAKQVGELLSDPSVPISDAFEQIGRFDEESYAVDGNFIAQIAIWSLAHKNKVARAKLNELYNYFDAGHLEAWRAALQSYEDAGVKMRAGLTNEEFVAILSAIAEGLAVRAAVDPSLAKTGLTGRAMSLVVEAVLGLPGDDTEIGDKLRQIDQARLSGNG